jgi:hypothetical protein
MTNKDFFNSIDNKLFDVTLIVDKEEELKHVTKSALFHNIIILTEQLDEITKERDIIVEQEKRLTEENDNLKKIIERLKEQKK